jgi:hypothetical protein
MMLRGIVVVLYLVTMADSVQSAQKAALLALLSLDVTRPSSTSRSPSPIQAAPVWKILVLDDVSKDILATVLRVQDLRDVGVTLHV